MKLIHEKTEYIFTDRKSENDAILIGYLTAGIDYTVKKLLQKQKRTVAVITIEDISENNLSSTIDEITHTIFDWSLCENLFLLKAYKHFTPKMQRIFNYYYLQDKPVTHIAEMECCTQRAVNRTLQRCREYIILEKQQEEKRNVG